MTSEPEKPEPTRARRSGKGPEGPLDNDQRLTGWIEERRGKPVFMGALGAFAVGLVLWGVVLALVVAGVNSAAGPSNTAAPVAQEPQAPVVDCRALEAKTNRSEAESAIFRANCAQPPVNPTAQAAEAPAPAPAQPQSLNRQDCSQIRGTQYRSTDERDWFLGNCSGVPAPQGQGGENRANCDQIRGTPYRSDVERQWYLSNCSNTPATQTQATGQNRANCDAIRGTQYLSEAERQWYQGNCSGTQAQPQQQPQPQPQQPVDPNTTNRADCDQISGTPYISLEERDWFLANCM